MERDYTVAEIAAMWKLSAKTIRRLFKDDPGVMKLVGRGLAEGTAERGHITLRIPESAVNRVREQLTKATPKPVVTAARPPRPIRRIPRARAA